MESAVYKHKAAAFVAWAFVIAVGVFAGNIQLLFCDPFLNGYSDRSFLYFNARFAFALCFLMLLLCCVYVKKLILF